MTGYLRTIERSSIVGNKEPEEGRSGARPCALLAYLRILVFPKSMGKPSEVCKQCGAVSQIFLVAAWKFTCAGREGN